MEALYRHGAELAAKAFTAQTLPDYLDAMPRAYAETIDDQGRDDLEHAWTEATLAGLDPRELWVDATDNLDTANSPAAVIAHRIRHVTSEKKGTPSSSPPRPQPHGHGPRTIGMAGRDP